MSWVSRSGWARAKCRATMPPKLCPSRATGAPVVEANEVNVPRQRAQVGRDHRVVQPRTAVVDQQRRAATLLRAIEVHVYERGGARFSHPPPRESSRVGWVEAERGPPADADDRPPDEVGCLQHQPD